MARDDGLVTNMGAADRMGRFGVGLMMLGLPALVGWAAWLTALLAAWGGVQLVIAVTGYSALYHWLGVSTLPRRAGLP
jgi:hypothetical protein